MVDGDQVSSKPFKALCEKNIGMTMQGGRAASYSMVTSGQFKCDRARRTYMCIDYIHSILLEWEALSASCALPVFSCVSIVCLHTHLVKILYSGKKMLKEAQVFVLCLCQGHFTVTVRSLSHRFTHFQDMCLSVTKTERKKWTTYMRTESWTLITL